MKQQFRINYIPTVAIAGAVVVLCAFYYGSVIPYGALYHFDEFYTLGRTLGFVESGDWLSVSFNNQPDFKKPPLQYWLGALLIQSGVDPMLSVRLWPLSFALALLGVTGLLAYACQPGHPYVISAALILLSGSPLLWTHATRALLDAGSAFFLTLSVAAVLLALRNPRWWIIAGLSVGLGFLQKSPSALVASVYIIFFSFLLSRYFSLDVDVKASVRTGYFAAGALITLVLISFWPIVQFVRYGFGYLFTAFYAEILLRFAPSGSEGADSFSGTFDWLSWMLRDSAFIWVPALAALCVLPFIPKLRARLGLVALIVLMILIVLTFAGGKLYPRYLLQVLPILAVVLTVTLEYFVKVQPLLPLIALILVILTGGPFYNMSYLLNDRWSEHAEVAKHFAGVVREDETPVMCSWGDRKYIPPGVLVLHTNFDRPIVFLEGANALNHLRDWEAIAPPLRGICLESAFLDIQDKLERVTEIEKVRGYVIWRAADLY